MSASDSDLYIGGLESTNIELGRDTFGVDYEVLLCQTPCCAKKIHKKLLTDEKALREFLRVCERWCVLRHPHIHQFLGLWNSPSSPIPLIVTEKMDCKLSTLLTQHTKESFPFRNKAQILYQVSLGLAFLHGRVPVTAHGDVTSDSVLVDWSSNRAKLTNIAMATVCSSKSTRTGLLQSLSLKTDEEASSKLILSTVDDVKAFGFLSLHALNHTPPKCNLSFTNAVFKDDESLDDVIKRIHCTILTHDEDRFVSRVVTKCLKYCTIASSTLAAEMKGIVEECTEVSAVKLHHMDNPRSEKHTGSSSVQGGSSETSTGREAPPTIAVGSTQPIKCKKGKSHRVSTQGLRPSSMPSSDIDAYVNIIPALPRSLQTRQTFLGAEGGEGSINSEENELIRRIIEIENVESGEGIMPSADDCEEKATKKEPNKDHCVYFLEEILTL